MAEVEQKTSGGNAAYHNFHNDFVHIQDPNERRRLALAEVDKAPFGWYHVRAIVVAGVGFFTDSYDIFVASLLTTMLGIVYFPGKGSMPTASDTAIKLATSAGTVIGQVSFGIAADIVSRGGKHERRKEKRGNKKTKERLWTGQKKLTGWNSSVASACMVSSSSSSSSAPSPRP